ncbi:hypothetical protein ACUHMQ_14210 [Chitinimonas sp. PSY-7]|uniref:hypothetical protein n=1 Tax=Chitinimonas sp. PSY-7 TaxID=3459088 RepID=UPI0040402B6A
MCIGHASACQMSLIYNTDPSPPYITSDNEVPQEKPGAVIELLQMAAKQIGCTLVLTRLPNKRLLAETKIGIYDAAILYSYSPERALSYAYPMQGDKPDSQRRITTLAYYLYKLKGSPVNWDGQQFSGINGPIGVNYGWSVGKDILAHGMKISESYTTKQNLIQLHLGRLEAYATFGAVGDAVIQQENFKDIERLPTPISKKDYFLIFNIPYYQKNTDQVEKYWTEIGKLRESALPGLLKKYDSD